MMCLVLSWKRIQIVAFSFSTYGYFVSWNGMCALDTEGKKYS